MCSLSAVMDYGQRQWPDLIKHWPQPEISPPGALPPIRIVPPHKFVLEPIAPPVGDRLPTKDEIEAFLKLVRAAEEFDKRANQPHCEDPEKIKLLEAIERRLAAIEAKLEDEPAAPPEPAYVTLGEACWSDEMIVPSMVTVIDLDTGAPPVDDDGTPYEIITAQPGALIVLAKEFGGGQFFGLGSKAGSNVTMRIAGRFEIRYPAEFLRDEEDTPTPSMQAAIALHRELTGVAS